MKFLRQFQKSKNAAKDIIVVSGLPRSGTSMMMKMLEAGGIELFTDGIRQADEDNPAGYFEFEKVKALRNGDDKAWLPGAQGKAIKVISHLLSELPSDHRYKVIFMNRCLQEVLASQNKMLSRKGNRVELSSEDMIRLYQKHLKIVKTWLDRQPNISVVEVEHREVIRSPLAEAQRIRKFLGDEINVTRMADAVDGRLYRNRV